MEQLNIFEAPPAPKREPEPEPVNEMHLELDTGEVLARPLQDMLKDKMDEEIIITPKMIRGRTSGRRIKYPKGVTVRGKYKTIVDGHVFTNILSHKPSLSFKFAGGVRRDRMKGQGIGKKYCQIIINGKVIIKHRKFEASIPNLAEKKT